MYMASWMGKWQSIGIFGLRFKIPRLEKEKWHDLELSTLFILPASCIVVLDQWRTQAIGDIVAVEIHRPREFKSRQDEHIANQLGRLEEMRARFDCAKRLVRQVDHVLLLPETLEDGARHASRPAERHDVPHHRRRGRDPGHVHAVLAGHRPNVVQQAVQGRQQVRAARLGEDGPRRQLVGDVRLGDARPGGVEFPAHD